MTTHNNEKVLVDEDNLVNKNVVTESDTDEPEQLIQQHERRPNHLIWKCSLIMLLASLVFGFIWLHLTQSSLPLSSVKDYVTATVTSLQSSFLLHKTLKGKLIDPDIQIVQDFYKKKFTEEELKVAMQEQTLIRAAQKVVFRLFGSNKLFDTRVLLTVPMLVNDNAVDPQLQNAVRTFMTVFLSSPEQSKEAWLQYLQAFTKWNKETPGKLNNLDEGIKNFDNFKELQAQLTDISAIADKTDETEIAFSNLNIVHELVVNPRFSMTDLFSQSTFNDSLHKSVQIVAKDPQHLHTLVVHLFADIRKQLLLLDSQKSHFLKDIERLTTLNTKIVSPDQILDHYENILDLMSQMCSPSKDEKIYELLSSIRHTYNSDNFDLRLFLSITTLLFQLLEGMRHDMMRYKLQPIMPFIFKHAAAYESQALTSMKLELRITKEWLANSLSTLPQTATVNAIWADAMARLILDSNMPLPETLFLDTKRVNEWRNLTARAFVESPISKDTAYSNLVKAFESPSTNQRPNDDYPLVYLFVSHHWQVYSTIYAQIVNELEP